MITDEELERFRIEEIKVRVVRDYNPDNDVRGFVIAWDDQFVLVRKPSRNVVKLSRNYFYQPAREERKWDPSLLGQ